jgi:hypothetical protein
MSPLLRVESGCRLVALKSPSTFSRLCRPRYVDARKIGVGRIERRPLAHHAVGPAKAVLRRIFAAASPPIGRDHIVFFEQLCSIGLVDVRWAVSSRASPCRGLERLDCCLVFLRPALI